MFFHAIGVMLLEISTVNRHFYYLSIDHGTSEECCNFSVKKQQVILTGLPTTTTF
jgi:hypothetical protein